MPIEQQSIITNCPSSEITTPIKEGYGVVKKSCNEFMLHKEVTPISDEEISLLERIIDDHFEGYGISVCSIIIFGSSVDPDRSMKNYSDLDFTIIVESFDGDYDEREKNSPELKEKIINSSVDSICAFNIYTQHEFNEMMARKSWLARTMLTNPLLVKDNGFIGSHLEESIVELHEDRQSKYEWSNSSTNRLDDIHLDTLTYVQAVMRDSTNSDLISNWYDVQISRNKYIELTRHSNGKILTNPSLSDYCDISPLEYELNILHPFLSRTGIPDHLEAGSTASDLGYGLFALYHFYMVAKIIMLQRLYEKGVIALDGEVSQLFFRQFKDFTTEDRYKKFFYSLHKAEQILGRSLGIYSFDVDHNGHSFFEDISTTTDRVTRLIDDMHLFIEHLEGIVTNPVSNPSYYIKGDNDISSYLSISLFPTQCLCNTEDEADYILETSYISKVSPFFLSEVFSRFSNDRIKYVFVGEQPVTSFEGFVYERKTPVTNIFAYIKGAKPIIENDYFFNFDSTYINLNFE